MSNWTPTATSIWLAFAGLLIFFASRVLYRRAQYYRVVAARTRARAFASVLFFVGVALFVVSLVVYVITGAA